MVFSRALLLTFMACACLDDIQAFVVVSSQHHPYISSSSSLSATDKSISAGGSEGWAKNLRNIAATATFGLFLLASPTITHADGSTKEFKLPPIDKEDKNRCVLTGSKMGQANAARDKLYDLRMCNLSGKDASGLDLSGVIMTNTDVSKAKFIDAYFSKGYLHDSNFDGADFTNGIVDRASFSGSSLKGAIFQNSVLTGTSFENANVEGADFTEAALGVFDIKSLCRNPTLTGTNPTTGVETRLSVGCKD